MLGTQLREALWGFQERMMEGGITQMRTVRINLFQMLSYGAMCLSTQELKEFEASLGYTVGLSPDYNTYEAGSQKEGTKKGREGEREKDCFKGG